MVDKLGCNWGFGCGFFVLMVDVNMLDVLVGVVELWVFDMMVVIDKVELNLNQLCCYFSEEVL